MKVLWLSNCILIESDIASTGTWIQSMADALLDIGTVELAVISVGSVAKFTRQDYRGILQWVIPSSDRLGENGLPSDSLLKDIVTTIEQFKPDLIHNWGVEYFWGLLTVRKYISMPALLEMQGMKKAIAKYITADLTVKELFQCIWIKELLRQTTIHSTKKKFIKWGQFEEEVIRGHSFVDVPSEWMFAQVKAINPIVQIFFVDLALRPSFYLARPWSEFESKRNMQDSAEYIFCSFSGGIPYKGIHVAIRALAEVIKIYPKTRLRIAGNIQKKKIVRMVIYVGLIH